MSSVPPERIELDEAQSVEIRFQISPSLLAGLTSDRCTVFVHDHLGRISKAHFHCGEDFRKKAKEMLGKERI